MKFQLQKYAAPFLLGLLVAVLGGLIFAAMPQKADAQAEPTYEFLLEKKISDNKPTNPYTADEFSFNVSGYGTVNLTASTDDYASAIVLLPAGTYTLEEVGPDGFVEDDWTVQWSGYACDNYNGPIVSTTMNVTDDATGNVCRADNQFRGEPEPILGCTDPDAENYDPAAEEDDGSCEYDNGGGNGGDEEATLTITKVVVGTSTSPTNFSFSINNGTSTAFEADGSNTLTVATGTYGVTEVGTTTGYTVTYNNCASIVLQDGDSATCTITNTLTTNGGGGGGNGTSTELYRIEGFVWHDEDKNGEIATSTESFLEGWTVTATNGTTTMSTTTDATGYYYFDVEAGTWTISETLMSSWSQSYPANNQHVVTVPEAEEVTLGFPLNLFFSVAHAAVVETFGDYNFGNYQTGDSGGSGGGGGGGGGTSHIAGTDSSVSGGRGGGDGTPQVLGEQVAAVPFYAPYAGHGGASPNLPGFLAFFWPMLAWFGY